MQSAFRYHWLTIKLIADYPRRNLTKTPTTRSVKLTRTPWRQVFGAITILLYSTELVCLCVIVTVLQSLKTVKLGNVYVTYLKLIRWNICCCSVWTLLSGKIHGSSRITMFAMLALSASFDCVDHTILLHRLHMGFGLTDVVLEWILSFLPGSTSWCDITQLSWYLIWKKKKKFTFYLTNFKQDATDGCRSLGRRLYSWLPNMFKTFAW